MIFPRLLAPAIFLIAFSSACATVEHGVASYYADSLHGNLTASGEPYDASELTAAHPSLDFGTRVEVTNLENGRSVVVTINDRGPHVDDRVIDLSRAAAEELGMLDSGLVDVRLEILN